MPHLQHRLVWGELRKSTLGKETEAGHAGSATLWHYGVATPYGNGLCNQPTTAWISDCTAERKFCILQCAVCTLGVN